MRYVLFSLTALFMMPVSFSFSADIDIESLGRPIDDDTRGMYERFVYFDEAEAAQHAPLDMAVVSQSELADLSVMAASNALMMTFQDYQQRLDDIRRYFTDQGWAEYNNMLEQVDLINTLASNYYILSAALNGVPIVGAHGVPEDGEAYEWDVAVPLILTYSREAGGKTETYPFEMMVRMTLRRVKTGPTWHNIKINSWKIVQS